MLEARRNVVPAESMSCLLASPEIPMSSRVTVSGEAGIEVKAGKAWRPMEMTRKDLRCAVTNKLAVFIPIHSF